MKRRSPFSRQLPYSRTLSGIVLLLFGLLLFVRSAYPPSFTSAEGYFLDVLRLLPPVIAPLVSVFFLFVGIVAMRITTNTYVLYDEMERNKSLPLSLLLILLFPISLGTHPALLVLPFWALAHHALYAAYRMDNAPFDVTNCAIALSFGTILWPPSLLLLPIMLFNMIDLQAFSLRNLMAFLFGYFAPFFLFATVILIGGWGEEFIHSLEPMIAFAPIGQNPLPNAPTLWIGGAILLLLSLAAAAATMIRLSEKKVKVLQLTATLIRTLFLLLGGLLFSQHLEGYLLLLILPIATLLSGVIRTKRSFNILSLLLIILLLLVWGLTYNLYSF